MINFYFTLYRTDLVKRKLNRSEACTDNQELLLAKIPLWQILCGLNVLNHKTLVHCKLALVFVVKEQLCLIKCIFSNNKKKRQQGNSQRTYPKQKQQ